MLDIVVTLDGEDKCANEFCVSHPDADDIMADGVKSMHISVANSIEDDRSSVEILSPTFSSHYKQTGMFIYGLGLAVTLLVTLHCYRNVVNYW